MKKVLSLLLVLAATTALSACSDTDNHGVIFNHGGFFNNLFGAVPAQQAPMAVPAPDALPEKT